MTVGSLVAQSSDSSSSTKERQAPAGAASEPNSRKPFFLLTGQKQVTPTRPTPAQAGNFVILSICCNPPDGTVGINYFYQFTVTGGEAPYTWNVTSFLPSARPGGAVPSDLRKHIDAPPAGGLPPGLTLDSSGGFISGIPTQTGTFNFYVTVQDMMGDFSDFTPFSITINNPVCIPTVVGRSLPAGEVDVRYAAGVGAVGCSNKFTYSASGLPPGLGIDSSSGAITGTPQSSGSFNVTVTATDSVQGTSGSANFTLTINPPPSITSTSPLPGGMAGVKYTYTFTATGGTTPYSWVVQGLPQGFSMSSAGVLTVASPNAGTFTFSVAVRDSQAVETSFQAFSVTFTSTAPLLQVSPASLTFNAIAGGDPPATQAISVSPLPTDTTTPSFSVTVDGGTSGSAPPFSITVKPTSATAPQQLVVSVDQGTMPAGNLSARIRIIDADNAEYDVTANLVIASASPQLQVNPGALRFAARSQAPGVIIQNLAVNSSGGGGPLGFSASVTNGSSWLSISPSSGQTVRGTATFIQVTVNPQGLQVGAYHDTLHFASSANPVDVPVELFVAASGPILGVNVTGLRFQARQNGGFSNSQQVEVLNAGDATSTVNWTASLVSGASTFSLSQTSGAVTGSNFGSLTISPTATAIQQSPGGYYGLVSISDPHSMNSPQYVVAVLDLESNATPPLPDPSPAGLLFTVALSGSQSPGQTVTVNTSSATSVPFQIAATTTDGANWLIPSSTSGSSSGQTPGTFTVAVNPSPLTAAGIYTGQVSVSMSGTVRTVNVTAIVLPKGSTIPTSSTGRETPDLLPHQAAGCTPSKLALTETGLVNNFAVPASWPATLIVRLNDDCGNSVTNGSVMASFSNGDPPLALGNAGQASTYSATWQPQNVTSQIRVNLNAKAGSLQPATLLMNGGVSANQTPAPVLYKGGTVAPFYRVSDGPLSPGTIVEVYGSGLASTNVSTGAPPLPNTFNGTTVLIGGIQAPLYFLSSGQLDVQVPLELPGNQQPLILVSVNGALTLPDELDVIPVAPVVDTYSSGQIVAQHGDYSLITSSSPAKPGEYIMIYLLGMGATNPTIPSGQPAPSTTLAQVTVAPMITIGGIQVPNTSTSIPFAGFTPGFAGLYQISFQVPTATPSGNQNIVISQNGIVANAATLPVSQ